MTLQKQKKKKEQHTRAEPVEQINKHDDPINRNRLF